MIRGGAVQGQRHPVALMQLTDGSRQQGAGHVRHHAHVQVRGTARMQGLDLARPQVQIALHVARPQQGQLPQRRGLQAATAAQQARRADAVLPLGQRLGDGGLAEAGGGRHPGQRAMLGDVGQQRQVAVLQAVGQSGGITAHGFLYNQMVIQLCQQS
ncbi:hypothetical protein G6F57_022365 [Rhizopus arrhizus]|nr:hypothetical protein G6F57_022365 [Rhizopus arrhizus]